ncbi:Nitrilase family, member 2 [Seminavis robusta]|uniref:Nitrilase family, member 2 n=1 Tax=Seminavis robusta TaxID=568900 RepID=A0A9N8EPK0_9STRA|nr:Nitrilase family, member 2 [Seminavis robusta]|eukprot:Sro1496_g277490.1 Nitrilase family, member 2 (205) ;mRNA; f:6780-7572
MGAFPLPRRSNKIANMQKAARKTKKNDESSLDSKMKPFPEGWVPGDKDVICGRGGKSMQKHPGNQFYRDTIEHFLPLYANAQCKLDKSLIVSSVVAVVRDASPKGGFVREENGQWYEASELLVRERIGASLRDMLHTKYSSSTKSKKKRRKQVQDKINEEVEEILHRQECKEIVGQLEKISKELDDDNELQEAFNKANRELLMH